MTSPDEIPESLRGIVTSFTEPFWQATREHRLVMQRCESCGYVRWPPGPICTQCQSPDSSWADVRQEGVLYSYAVYHRVLGAGAGEDEIPYTVGLVDLDDGPRMYGRIEGTPTTEDVGGKVSAVFSEVAPGFAFVQWRLV